MKPTNQTFLSFFLLLLTSHAIKNHGARKASHGNSDRTALIFTTNHGEEAAAEVRSTRAADLFNGDMLALAVLTVFLTGFFVFRFFQRFFSFQAFSSFFFEISAVKKTILAKFIK